MARGNIPFLAFNRGLVSPKALARVDLDRTKLSAEVMTNWLPKSQGAMSIRPGTKYLGSSYGDTGAEWIEFVASTDDTALIELTHQKMRIWIDDALLGRPNIATSLTITDTGWDDASTGGTPALTTAVDEIPVMTGRTTNGVTISQGTEVAGSEGFRAADEFPALTRWVASFTDTGLAWLQVDFGAGNAKKIKTHTVTVTDDAAQATRFPKAWNLLSNDVDTGTGWTTEVTVTNQTGWATGEKRTFNDTGYSDTGGNSRRFWRLQFTQNNGSATFIEISDLEMLLAAAQGQAYFSSSGLRLNAGAIGSTAKGKKQVVVDTGDRGVEHSLDIQVGRGPVTFRVGSTNGDDDYVSETSLGTGRHNLAFTPSTNFHVTVQSNEVVDRVVSSLDIGDTGTVEIIAPWDANDLGNIRYDQSADVVYVDCDGVKPQKIERRGTGRSWSVVEYEPYLGPFQSAASSTAKLSVSQLYGNTTLNSDIPFFRAGHVGALMRLFHNGQSGVWYLGARDAVTDAIEVTGINDTGTSTSLNERYISVVGSGTYTGQINIQRSFDGADRGFHNTDETDSGSFTRTFQDPDDNVKVWYRVKMTSYTSGAAKIVMTYKNGGINGIGRVTGFTSNTAVSIEMLRRFSDTGPTDSWQEGEWSSHRGYPSSVALHGGRLFHSGGANLKASVPDDYENFDDETEGDAAPLAKTLGAGPVDNIYYLISLLRLIVGTSGAEMAVRSSSIDEPLTPDNASIRAFSTQGSSNLRALKMDTNAIIVQRSGQRVFEIGFGQGIDALGDYQVSELTILVPDLLEAGVVSLAIQRQPDTRIHFVRGDGKVAILTYEPKEEVLCWSMWDTDGTVERAMVLPGANEDRVYYHINRTINGATKRYLEKWALESECTGDTGLSWLADCAKSFTDTGRATVITGLSHLNGESAIVWGDDTGQSFPSKDYSYDTGGVQKTWAVAAGSLTLTGGNSVHHAVVGLPYTADWKSTKLAYAAEAGTALAQMKKTELIGFVLYKAHNSGLFFGNDTGNLDPMPRVTDRGAAVDPRKVFDTFDQTAMPFPGLWDTDSRIVLRAKAPRPMTVLAAVPNIQTVEKI